MEKNNRKNYTQIRLNDEEKKLLERKFKLSGFKSKSDFIRTMIFEGVIVKIDEKMLQDITRKISGASANVNQIAVRVNSTGNIYAPDVENLNKDYQKLLAEHLKLKAEMHKILSK